MDVASLTLNGKPVVPARPSKHQVAFPVERDFGCHLFTLRFELGEIVSGIIEYGLPSDENSDPSLDVQEEQWMAKWLKPPGQEPVGELEVVEGDG